MSIKKIVVATVLTVTMALGVGIADAQDERPPQHPGAGAFRALVEIVAEDTGLEPQEIAAQLRSGTSLADIITSNGGDVDEVIDAAVSAATEHINAALADGRISEERAERMLANLEEVVTRAVNGELPGRGGRPIQDMLARGLVRQVAQATELEVSDVVEQLRAGSTIADILTANGVDVEAFTQDVLSRASERLTQAVANGRITQEEADEMIARLTERLPELLNASRTAEGSV